MLNTSRVKQVNSKVKSDEQTIRSLEEALSMNTRELQCSNESKAKMQTQLDLNRQAEIACHENMQSLRDRLDECKTWYEPFKMNELFC